MGVILYIIGVIIVICIFFITHKKNEITWKKSIMGILISLSSWFIIIVMTMMIAFIGIVFFIDWLGHLEFWNKKVF